MCISHLLLASYSLSSSLKMEWLTLHSDEWVYFFCWFTRANFKKSSHPLWLWSLYLYYLYSELLTFRIMHYFLRALLKLNSIILWIQCDELPSIWGVYLLRGLVCLGLDCAPSEFSCDSLSKVKYCYKLPLLFLNA